jgi:hypothetical protein
MKRVALAVAWVSLVCLPAMSAEAGLWWRRAQRCDTSYYVYSRPATGVQTVTPAGPPSAPPSGVIQQNQAVEPDVVLPAEIVRPTMAPSRSSSRSNVPGEAQQRRLRPGTPIR